MQIHIVVSSIEQPNVRVWDERKKSKLIKKKHFRKGFLDDLNSMLYILPYIPAGKIAKK